MTLSEAFLKIVDGELEEYKDPDRKAVDLARYFVWVSPHPSFYYYLKYPQKHAFFFCEMTIYTHIYILLFSLTLCVFLFYFIFGQGEVSL
jgi:hypothetical protein